MLGFSGSFAWLDTPFDFAQDKLRLPSGSPDRRRLARQSFSKKMPGAGDRN